MQILAQLADNACAAYCLQASKWRCVMDSNDSFQIFSKKIWN
jgi:hypothetical protein